MSAPNAIVSPDRQAGPTVRGAGPADHAAIREVVIAAYAQYAGLIPSDAFSHYLEDLLDLDGHARHGQLLVTEVDGRVRGYAAFYRDSSVQGFGWPRGWAGGRGLAVHPAARGHGVARILLAACERLARSHGAPMFAFHTATFMTGAIALYEQLGYRRAPRFDIDLGARFGGFGATSSMAIAYVRQLAPRSEQGRRVRCGQRPTGAASGPGEHR